MNDSNKPSGNMKELKISLPVFSITRAISPEQIEAPGSETLERLKAVTKTDLESYFKKWMETEYNDFFRKEIERNQQNWQEQQISQQNAARPLTKRNF